jgi:hypothetical protein
VRTELAGETTSPQWQESADDSGGASLNDYLARLLQRVSGPAGHTPHLESPKPAAAHGAAANPPQTKAPSEARLALLDDASPLRTGRSLLSELTAAERVPDPAASASEFETTGAAGQGAATIRHRPEAARVMPPECETSLEAMRELANFSARTAIQAFDQQRSRRVAWAYIGLLVMGLLSMGGALHLFLQAEQLLAYGGVCLGGLVATFGGFKALRLLRAGNPNTPLQKSHAATPRR